MSHTHIHRGSTRSTREDKASCTAQAAGVTHQHPATRSQTALPVQLNRAGASECETASDGNHVVRGAVNLDQIGAATEGHIACDVELTNAAARAHGGTRAGADIAGNGSVATEGLAAGERQPRG